MGFHPAHWLGRHALLAHWLRKPQKPVRMHHIASCPILGLCDCVTHPTWRGSVRSSVSNTMREPAWGAVERWSGATDAFLVSQRDVMHGMGCSRTMPLHSTSVRCSCAPGRGAVCGFTADHMCCERATCPQRNILCVSDRTMTVIKCDYHCCRWLA